MSGAVQRVVPTLTEVLDASELQFAESAVAIEAQAVIDAIDAVAGSDESDAMQPLDPVLRELIAGAVEASLDALRPLLLQRVETLVLQALESHSNRSRFTEPL